MKVLILDSGPLINLSMNGLLYIFEELKRMSDIRIMITESVKKEVVDRPMTIPRFELGALRVEKMISEKIIEMPEAFGIDTHDLASRTKVILDELNRTIRIDGKNISIVSEAECSCLAASQIFSKKGIENMIGIDERTTRTIFEKPENIVKLMGKKLHRKVYLASSGFRKMGKFRFIRSSEIVYVAHKKDLTHIKGKKALEALIYATKYKGCSISHEEINILKRL